MTAKKRIKFTEAERRLAKWASIPGDDRDPKLDLPNYNFNTSEELMMLIAHYGRLISLMPTMQHMSEYEKTYDTRRYAERILWLSAQLKPPKTKL